MNCDLLIVGSGPAAWSCAMTARMRGLSCVVAAASSASGWLYKTDKVMNYPGMPEVSGKELLQVFRAQAEALGAQVLDSLARQIQPLGDIYMTLVGNEIVESPAIALCMGAARPKLLPGEEELIGSGVSWCGTCDGMFYRGKKVAVLSAWHGGVEEAEFLSGLCSQVDYYTMQPHEKPAEAPWTYREGTPQSLRREADGLHLTTSAGEDTYDGVFIFRPAVAPDSLLPGLQTEGAFIPVDRRMATNLPLVYAAGDCTGQPLQIAKAVGEGNVAAISAAQDIAKLKKE